MPQNRGDKTDAVTAPLSYGNTELCPVHALELAQQAAGLAEGPVFRRICLPVRAKTASPGEPPPLHSHSNG